MLGDDVFDVGLGKKQNCRSEGRYLRDGSKLLKTKRKVLQSPLRRVYGSFEEVMEMKMTEAQNEVFLAIDVWWKKFHYGPSYRDIILLRGKGGLGSTKKIVDRLVKIGAVKRVEGMGRSVRPVYINFRDIE